MVSLSVFMIVGVFAQPTFRKVPYYYGYDWPSGYVWQSNGYPVQRPPDLDFELELRAYLNLSPHIPAWWQDRPTDQLALELHEVAGALVSRGVNQVILGDSLDAYSELWNMVPRIPFGRWYWYSLEDGKFVFSPEKAPADATSSDLDFSTFEPRLTHVPREFLLYLKGAAAFRQEKFRQAIGHWEALLELPQEERPHRSVWASFMIGRAWLHLDAQKCTPYFEACRELTAAGFEDPLGLRSASMGWQALAELNTGNAARAVRLYAEQHQVGSAREQGLSFQSLHFACQAIFEGGPPSDEALNDPLVREIITLWLLSQRGGERMYHSWAVALESRLPEEAAKMPGRMAQLFYLAGEFESTLFWADKGKEGDFYCHWFETKVQMHRNEPYYLENNLEALIDLFRELTEKGDPLALRYPELENKLWSELGDVLCRHGQYAPSVNAYIEGGRYRTATYLGECVLTSEELTIVVDNLAVPAESRKKQQDGDVFDYYEQYSIYAGLNEILARKLAREGKLDAAFARVPYLYYLDYKHALLKGRDPERSKRERARYLFLAARIMREHGRLCFGTTFAPDWPGYGWRVPTGRDRIQAGVAQPVEIMRINSNRPLPNRRYHYKWRAADLMWECAQLLPKNDELLAQALWYGGTYIAIDDPQGGDKFYKALVRRCGKLPVGKDADRRRWFPPKPAEWPYPADRVWN